MPEALLDRMRIPQPWQIRIRSDRAEARQLVRVFKILDLSSADPAMLKNESSDLP